MKKKSNKKILIGLSVFLFCALIGTGITLKFSGSKNEGDGLYAGISTATYTRRIQDDSGTNVIVQRVDGWDFAWGGTSGATGSADFWVDDSANKVWIPNDLEFGNATGSMLYVTSLAVGGFAVADLDMNGYKIVNIGDTGTDFDDNGGLTIVSSANLSAGHVSISDDLTGLDYLKFENGALLDNVSNAGILSFTEDLFDFNGQATISSDFQVEGNAYFDGFITDGTLTIDGSGNITGGDYFSFNNASASENIEAIGGKFTTIGSDGALTIDAFTLNGDITAGSNNITGLGHLGGATASLSEALSVDGTASISDSLAVSGTLDFPDDSVAEADINFSTACGTGNQLYISGGNLACESGLTGFTANSPLEFGSASISLDYDDTKLGVSGTSLTIDDIFVLNTGDTITGNFNVDALVSISDGLAIYGGVLDIDGVASSTFAGDLDIEGNVNIAGDLIATLFGNASTATALAANGGNCSAGNAPLGVDTLGAVESCFDVWTEAENTAAGYLSSITANAPLEYSNASLSLDYDGTYFQVSGTTFTMQDIFVRNTGDTITGNLNIDAVVSISDGFAVYGGTITLPDGSIPEADLDINSAPTEEYILGWNGSKLDYYATTSWAITYSAGGTLLDLTGSTFSINEGTLNDTALCYYSSGTGIVCNVSNNSSNWDSAYSWKVASESFYDTAYGWGDHSTAGYLKADGTVDLTGDWTIGTNNITLTAGTLTALNLAGTHVSASDDFSAIGRVKGGTISDGTFSITGGTATGFVAITSTGITGANVSVSDDITIGGELLLPWEGECHTIASPSATDIDLGYSLFWQAGSITNVYCYVQGGTSAVVTLGDGTNSLEAITCDADGQADDGSIVNGTFTANEQVEIDIGTVTGTVRSVTVCIKKQY